MGSVGCGIHEREDTKMRTRCVVVGIRCRVPAARLRGDKRNPRRVNRFLPCKCYFSVFFLGRGGGGQEPVSIREKSASEKPPQADERAMRVCIHRGCDVSKTLYVVTHLSSASHGAARAPRARASRAPSSTFFFTGKMLLLLCFLKKFEKELFQFFSSFPAKGRCATTEAVVREAQRDGE